MVTKNKTVLITGGPTNEYIDEVMKITNMSSGKIAVELANKFAENGYGVILLLTKTVKGQEVDMFASRSGCSLIRFETTDELLNALHSFAGANIDLIIHSAAVADYKPEFSFRLEDMADEIARYVHDNTKISSLEPNLTVKLGLTPKIIKSLRSWFPNAFICGFKLLEGVSEKELVDAAMKQIRSCNTNIVFANDLANLRKGDMSRLVVTSKGYNDIKVDGAEGIYHLLDIALME